MTQACVVSREVAVRMQQIAQQIRAFVVDNFLFGEDNGHFFNNDSFLDKGLIDSMGILTLVEFVKDKYSVSIEDEELVPDHWDSVERIAAFVHGKLASKN